MKFLGLGVPELIIILVVILLIFGPKNLPKLGSALGKTVSNLRSGMNEGKKKDVENDESSTPSGSESATQVAEIEGEVETLEPETATDDVDDAAAVATDPSADAEPKKVKRVVRKKVSTGE